MDIFGDKNCLLMSLFNQQKSWLKDSLVRVLCGPCGNFIFSDRYKNFSNVVEYFLKECVSAKHLKVQSTLEQCGG